MSKYKDQDGDMFFGHFDADNQNLDINTQRKQSFSIEEGTGKWKELVGDLIIKFMNCSIDLKNPWLLSIFFRKNYVGDSKICNISDATFERVKNYRDKTLII